MKGKPGIDRLDGQVGEYLEEYGGVIVVLLGNAPEEVVREVEYRCEKA
ncbi:MAG: hypothetical protein QXV32_00675 [Conexivisphaerales archaeon]